LLRAAGWKVIEVVPLFGEATAAGMYWLEPVAARFAKIRRPLAHRFAASDKWARARYSGVAVVAMR
jgi:hypothetical protein